MTDLKTYIIIQDAELKAMVDCYNEIYKIQPITMQQIDQQCQFKQSIIIKQKTIINLKEYYKVNCNLSL